MPKAAKHSITFLTDYIKYIYVVCLRFTVQILERRMPKEAKTPIFLSTGCL